MTFKPNFENKPLVNEFIEAFNNRDHHLGDYLEDLIAFMEYREHFKYYDPFLLEFLYKNLGMCEFVKDFMLRTWIYQNFVKGSLRQIAYTITKSSDFDAKNIGFFEKQYQVIKDSINLKGSYYLSYLGSFLGDYDHTKVINILCELINPSEFADELRDLLKENDIITEFANKVGK